MAFVFPTAESSPSFAAQAVIDATDMFALANGVSGDGLSGCQVSAQATPNMTVQVAAGTAWNALIPVTVAAVSSLSVPAASASDRRDIVTINAAGAVTLIQGTPCGTAGWTTSSTGLPPVKPIYPASSVLLAEIYVASNTTSITAANIVDKTLPAPTSGYWVNVVSVSANTTMADNQIYLVTGTATMTLPTPVAGGSVQAKNLPPGTVTVVTPSGNIDGAANDILTVPYQSASYVSDGTNWYRL